jgi:hypothetical protein
MFSNQAAPSHQIAVRKSACEEMGSAHDQAIDMNDKKMASATTEQVGKHVLPSDVEQEEHSNHIKTIHAFQREIKNEPFKKKTKSKSKSNPKKKKKKHKEAGEKGKTRFGRRSKIKQRVTFVTLLLISQF